MLREPVPYEAIARSIQTRHLQTPLERTVSFAPTEPQGKAAVRLHQENFDYAPVMDGPRVLGRVARQSLDPDSNEPIEALVEALSARMLVSADADLVSLMQALVEEGFRFVLDGTRISGLVTPADLNKQAGRMYLYVLISDFEVLLSTQIRGRFPDQTEVLEFLSQGRRQEILDRYELAQEQNTEADLVAYANLSDLFTISEKSVLHQRLGFSSLREWRSFSRELVGLRNDICHPTRPVLTQKRSLTQLVALEKRLISLLGQARKR